MSNWDVQILLGPAKAVGSRRFFGIADVRIFADEVPYQARRICQPRVGTVGDRARRISRGAATFTFRRPASPAQISRATRDVREGPRAADRLSASALFPGA